jgi:hypothetical protein
MGSIIVNSYLGTTISESKDEANFPIPILEILIMPASFTGTSYGGNMYSRELGVSATQNVYEHLRHQIINIRLELSTTISKNEVAKQYCV